MKRIIIVLLAVVFIVSVAASVNAELRPIVKTMLARLGWIQSITVDYALSDFEKLKGTANALAAQAKKVAESSDGPRKDFNQKLSDAATVLAEAADKKDGGLIATRLGEVLTICNKCHAAMRD